MTGRLVAVEGIAGSGKTEVSIRIAAHLRSTGLAVLETKEPGGTRQFTPAGMRLRALLLDVQRDPITATLGFELDRALTSLNLIHPALARGHWVVADRYYFGTIAYQSFGDGVALDLVDILSESALGHRYPDLSIVLDVPAGIARIRLEQRGSGLDVFDARDDGYHERVRQGYRAASERVGVRAAVVDASRPLEAVIQDAVALVESLRVVTK
jgi:dTMP kinase